MPDMKAVSITLLSIAIVLATGYIVIQEMVDLADYFEKEGLQLDTDFFFDPVFYLVLAMVIILFFYCWDYDFERRSR